MKLAFILTVLAAVFTDAGATEIPLRYFARDAQYHSVKLSPGGDYIAVAVPVGDQTTLAILRVSDGKPTGGLRLTSNEQVADYWWVGPQRVAASIAIKTGPLALPRLTGEILAIDVDGERRRYLFGYRGNVMNAGTRLAQSLTSARAWGWMVSPRTPEPDWSLIRVQLWDSSLEDGFQPLFRLNVVSGERTEVLRPPEPYLNNYLLDLQGHVRYASGRNIQNDWVSYIRNIKTGEWKQRDEGLRPNAIVTPISFSESENAAYFDSNEMDGDRYCLIRQDLENGKRSSVHCDAKRSLSYAVLSPDRTQPLAAVYATGKPEMHVLDSSTPHGKMLASLKQAFPGHMLDQFSWSQDGRLVAFRAYSDRNPGDFYLYEPDTKRAQRFFSSRSWIDPTKMGERRPIEFTARDGRSIEAYLTLPPGHAPSKLPLVVIPHGGPFGIHDDWSWDPEAQLLATRGYLVLQVNFRGSGAYGAAHFNAGKKNWGTGMINDITDGVGYAVSQGLADAERICIYGGSYGGYAALMSAVREPDLYKCAIGYAGVYDLHRFKKNTDIGQFQRGDNYLRDYLGDSDAIERDQSPITHLDKLKAAVMIVHGEEDERVPYEQAKILSKALNKRKYPYEWLSKPNEEHGFYKEENRIELYEKLLVFLERHIGKGGANPSPVKAE